MPGHNSTPITLSSTLKEHHRRRCEQYLRAEVGAVTCGLDMAVAPLKLQGLELSVQGLCKIGTADILTWQGQGVMKFLDPCQIN